MTLAKIKNRLQKAEEIVTVSAGEARFLEAVREMEEAVKRHVEEFNTSKAVARRKAEYEELQRIGEQRRAAFYRGESWDAYPLPWERTKSDYKRIH